MANQLNEKTHHDMELFQVLPALAFWPLRKRVADLELE